MHMTVNGRTYTVLRLLGHGKGGYSYLAEGPTGPVVVKQIHHEPCSYYTFGDKLGAELFDYDRLKAAGIPVPELLAVDREAERLVKAYIEDGQLWYIDYECNGYMDRWNFENWGVRYWSRTPELEAYLSQQEGGNV